MATSQLRVSSNDIFRLFVLFSTLLTIVSSTVIRAAHGNLTTNVAVNGNQCTDSYAWIGTGATSADCDGAVQRLHDAEVTPFSDIEFEFLSEKASRRSIPAMRTPRKYTVGKR